MRIVKWVLIIGFWAFLAAFLHYTLPQKDIVRITDTYERRTDPGENRWFWAQADVGSDGTLLSRDVFFIQTVRADGRVMVYRNEDTGWGWPPYFKFDTSNLQAEAADLRSTPENPKWALMTHYGWRFEFLSIFPNAVNMRPIAGPEVGKPLPWVNGLILFTLAALGWGIYVRWRRFRQKRLDPTLEGWQDSWEATEDAISERRRRWFGRRS